MIDCTGVQTLLYLLLACLEHLRTTLSLQKRQLVYLIFEVEGRSDGGVANISTRLLLFLRVALENRLDGQFVNPYSFPIF